MKLIAAVDANWAIGHKNQLLVRIPGDQRFFREMTTGKIVICGRKTLESFPGGKPLADRTNIVLTNNKEYTVKDALTAHSVEEVQQILEEMNADPEDVFVIGGAAVYRLFLPLCDTAYITKIDCEYNADAYCPNLDEDPEWEPAQSSEEQTYFDLTYHFVTYKRV